MTNRVAALLLALVVVLAGTNAIRANADGAVAAAAAPVKKVYEITYATEDLSTPMSWVQSLYFNNPQYKETRFEDYTTGAAIPPGGAHETAFYMAYRDDGLYMFFQSAEPGVDANGIPLESSLELYLAMGEGDIPYHQMIVPTSGSSIEYYEWQTEYRANRPLEGRVKVDSKPIPGGWGTVVSIPWEAVYDSLPLDSGNWQFNLIRWSPVDGETWGGQVHQPGRFNLLHFTQPTPEQRAAIEKDVLRKAWGAFQAKSAQLTDYWFTNPATMDKRFYNRDVLPLIVMGNADGSQIGRLDSLPAAEIDRLYKNVPEWMELRYNVDDLRLDYLRNALLDEHPDHVPPVTEAVKSGLEGKDGWYVSDAMVTLRTTDDASGVASTEYAITVVQSVYGSTPSTAGFVPYSAPIVFGDGVYELQYRSTDNAGNIEDAKTEMLRIDKTAPAFTIAANGSPLPEVAEFQDSRPIGFVLQAADTLSGVAEQAIAVDGAVYGLAATLNWAGHLGTHTITITVSDRAGNVTRSELHVVVKTSAASMKELVEQYVASGDLSRKLGDKLADDLNRAGKQEAKGNFKAAANIMRNFFAKIEPSKSEDTISDTAKAVLVTDGRALVHMWSQAPNHSSPDETDETEGMR